MGLEFVIKIKTLVSKLHLVMSDILSAFRQPCKLTLTPKVKLDLYKACEDDATLNLKKGKLTTSGQTCMQWVILWGTNTGERMSSQI